MCESEISPFCTSLIANKLRKKRHNKIDSYREKYILYMRKLDLQHLLR